MWAQPLMANGQQSRINIPEIHSSQLGSLLAAPIYLALLTWGFNPEPSDQQSTTCAINRYLH